MAWNRHGPLEGIDQLASRWLWGREMEVGFVVRSEDMCVALLPAISMPDFRGKCVLMVCDGAQYFLTIHLAD